MTDNGSIPAIIGRGYAQSELLSWLQRHWLPSGPCVCVIEGFSGIGKTYLSNSLQDVFKGTSALVDISNAKISFDDLMLRVSDALAVDADVKLLPGSDIQRGFQEALRNPLLVVFDNFEYCLEETGTAEAEFMSMVQRLCSRRQPGRILILTSRMVDEEEWQEHGAIVRTLGPAPAQEGGALLGRMLDGRNRGDELPQDQRAEVAGWLGCNPRAMQALVAALAFAPFGELVGRDPGALQADYRHVGEEFTRRLEKRFLAKTLENLTPDTLTTLQALSVHRKSFKSEAIEFAGRAGRPTTDMVSELTSLFMLDRRRDWYSLNPTVRELALQAIRRDPRALVRAHGHAADYYVRPFKARRVTITMNGTNFLEARHHLVLARREAEMRELAKRFSLHVQRSHMTARPLPVDPHELNEQTLLLQAALEGGSPSPQLNLRLARMLLARDASGDLELALEETTEAIRLPHASEETWMLHVRLMAKKSGIQEAIDTLTAAAASSDAVPLGCWLTAGELLTEAGRPLDAVDLLRRVIADYRPVGRESQYAKAVKLLESLYVRAVKLLESEGRGAEAVALLEAGLVDCEKSAAEPLYQVGMDLYTRRDDLDAALTVFTKGVERVSAAPSSLFQAGIELHVRRGDLDAALAVLTEGLERVSGAPASLYQAGIELYVRRGDLAEAVDLLTEGLRRVSAGGLASLYQAGIEVHIRRDDLDAALALLTEGLERVPAASLASLYQAGIELHVRRGELDEALAAFTEGLERAQPSNRFSLYQAGIELHTRRDDLDAAMTLGFEGLDRLSEIDSRHKVVEALLYVLYGALVREDRAEDARGWWTKVDNASGGVQRLLSSVLRHAVAGEWREGWLVAVQYRREGGVYAPLLGQEIFCALAAGETAAAGEAAEVVDLSRIRGSRTRRRPMVWLLGLVYKALGRAGESRKLLAEYWDIPVDQPVLATTYLHLWEESGLEFGPKVNAFFPGLPPRIRELASATPAPESGAADVVGTPQKGRPRVPRVEIDAVRGRIDFGIMSIRDDEYEAVLDRFAPDRFVLGDQRYELGTVRTTEGKEHTFASVRCLEQGQGYAQRVATHLIHDLEPRWLLVIGIAGAVPSRDYSLGDVVCASRVHDFSVRAVTESHRDTFNSGGGPVHPEVERALAGLPALRRAIADWSSGEAIGLEKPRLSVPAIDSPLYYGGDSWKADVHGSLTHHFPADTAPRAPLVTARSVAASDSLVKSTGLLAQWQESARSVAAVEMELGGVYLAARQVRRDVPVLAIRGISDVVGFRRDEAWTKYACASAASFAHAVIAGGNLFEPQEALPDVDPG
ncbi:tetratricopeptide (TPR) repeat protein/nucleoside phosphorylase [Streptomyces sp. 3330]|uniref:phosphorylase family protein n=1 Tax=Streptomyces sp. 3330 TaxID=2817755 RepID=UPI0028641E60|nr:hypothetical protein [Streptomyces sp. 3330]MDR6974018.1 tetratricopeptide (TPR) repeat protein/nucleoside phosphorylase [Streptomyces sp. 3330]